VADSLKARGAVCIEAEHIHDLDLADPIRDIVLESINTYDSALVPAFNSADSIWRKQLSFAPGASLDFNLRTGKYNGGANSMLDGFSQLVRFTGVSLLQIKAFSSSGATNTLYLQTRGVAAAWKGLLPASTAIAPYSAVALVGDSVLTLQTSTIWGVDAGASYGSVFYLEANGGNTGDTIVDLIIIGIKP
jgi:hypothetical protein